MALSAQWDHIQTMRRLIRPVVIIASRCAAVGTSHRDNWWQVPASNRRLDGFICSNGACSPLRLVGFVVGSALLLACFFVVMLSLVSVLLISVIFYPNSVLGITFFPVRLIICAVLGTATHLAVFPVAWSPASLIELRQRLFNAAPIASLGFHRGGLQKKTPPARTCVNLPRQHSTRGQRITQYSTGLCCLGNSKYSTNGLVLQGA